MTRQKKSFEFFQFFSGVLWERVSHANRRSHGAAGRLHAKISAFTPQPAGENGALTVWRGAVLTTSNKKKSKGWHSFTEAAADISLTNTDSVECSSAAQS